MIDLRELPTCLWWCQNFHRCSCCCICLLLLLLFFYSMNFLSFSHSYSCPHFTLTRHAYTLTHIHAHTHTRTHSSTYTHTLSFSSKRILKGSSQSAFSTQFRRSVRLLFWPLATISRLSLSLSLSFSLSFSFSFCLTHSLFLISSQRRKRTEVKGKKFQWTNNHRRAKLDWGAKQRCPRGCERRWSRGPAPASGSCSRSSRSSRSASSASRALTGVACDATSASRRPTAPATTTWRAPTASTLSTPTPGTGTRWCDAPKRLSAASRCTEKVRDALLL